jgi:peptidyl-prolyl cis-trans isomerase SurA
MLVDFKQKLLAGEAEFDELAKEYSEDPGSALRGGSLGWANPETFVVAFKEALARLDKGEMGEPFRTVHGWHLVEVIDKRVLDATDKLKEDKAYQLIFNRRFAEEKDTWLREMRDTAYIEVLDEKSAG